MYPADLCHEELIKNVKPSLAFDENRDYEIWKEAVRAKLTELLGDMPAERCDLNIRVEWEKEHETFFEKRIVFTSEENVDVPCHLWIPKDVQLPCPVVICLQGHSTGMHISMDRAIYSGDEQYLQRGDSNLAVQAIENGYAALSIDQRGFGERKSEVYLKEFPDAAFSCVHPAMTAILLGRTLIGERTWDISRAIDMLETMPDVINTKKILLTGNSGGGTATYYTACVEPRITMALPSSSICAFQHSIVQKWHCPCNYIPGLAKYVDMGELACLIAPRPLVVVAGHEDAGFLVEGSREVVQVIEKIYEKAGAADKFRYIEHELGHRYRPELSWPVVHELFD